MTSLLSGIKQNNTDIGYYINVASLAGKVNAFNGNDAAPQFSCARWASPQNVGALSTAVNTAGSLVMRDMGKTVVSAGRAFRKFQAVSLASASTGGVTGGASTSTQPGYFTAYLEVTAPNAGGLPAAVNAIARYA